MDDDLLTEQAQSLVPVYVDGFGAFRKVNGVLRCVGFVLQGGAQLNLIVSLAGTGIAIQEAQRALDEGPRKGFAVWNGLVQPVH